MYSLRIVVTQPSPCRQTQASVLVACEHTDDAKASGNPAQVSERILVFVLSLDNGYLCGCLWS
jgi:hypothetical protein